MKKERRKFSRMEHCLAATVALVLISLAALLWADPAGARYQAEHERYQAEHPARALTESEKVVALNDCVGAAKDWSRVLSCSQEYPTNEDAGRQQLLGLGEASR